jgi:hypothetical protein
LEIGASADRQRPAELPHLKVASTPVLPSNQRVQGVNTSRLDR